MRRTASSSTAAEVTEADGSSGRSSARLVAALEALTRAEEGIRYSRERAEADAREVVAAIVAAAASPARPTIREVQRRPFSVIARAAESQG